MIVPTTVVTTAHSTKVRPWVHSNTSANPKHLVSRRAYKRSRGGATCQRDRSLTFRGVADAMASQWGELVKRSMAEYGGSIPRAKPSDDLTGVTGVTGLTAEEEAELRWKQWCEANGDRVEADKARRAAQRVTELDNNRPRKRTRSATAASMQRKEAATAPRKKAAAMC
jgi:hypothetical protein